MQTIGFNVASGDKEITEDEIMTISGVNASINVIKDTLATLPMNLFKLDEQNAPTVVDDYRTKLINGDSNDTLNGFSLKQKVAKDLVIYGESVIAMEKLAKNENIVSGLYPLDTKRLQINLYSANGYKYLPEYQYNSLTGSYILDNSQIINIVKDSDDGITGKGVLQKGANILNLALAQSEFERKLLNSGAMPSGILEFPHPMNAEVLRQASEAFDKHNLGAENQGKTIALEGGVKYTPVQSTPDKMQLNNSKKQMLGQIARLFNIPETMINADSNKYKSNEENNIQFFQFCLKPILDAITSAFNKYLLLETEKEQGYYFEFNTDSIFQNTLEEKSQSILPLFNEGVLTYNEVRNIFGMPNGEGDDFNKMSLGNVLKYTDPNKPATVFNTQDSKNNQNNQNAEEQPIGNDKNNTPSNSNGQQSAKGGKNDTSKK